MTRMLHILHCPDDFQFLSVKLNRKLTTEEINRVAGCIGYGLTPHLHGSVLSEPQRVTLTPGSTTITFECDISTCVRSNPDTQAALFDMARYVQEGTPLRKTDQQGPGTRGTRLVEGIGDTHLSFSLGQSADEAERQLIDYPTVTQTAPVRPVFSVVTSLTT